MRTVQTSFLLLMAGIFLAVGSLKGFTLAKGGAWLLLADPVFPVFTNKQISWLALLVDASAATLLLLGRNPVVKLRLVAWLGGLFSAYHFAMAVLDPAAPCPCLGGHSNLFGLSQSATTNLIIGSAVAMLLGGYGLLLARRLAPSRFSTGVSPA